MYDTRKCVEERDSMIVEERIMNTNKQENKHLWIQAVLGFCLPVITMLWILKSCGFYPAGDRSALIMDMRDQYVEFYASLRQIIKGESSIFFSWSRSMGGNYFGLFAYYIANPLSWLTVFFPIRKLPLAMDVLLVLKIGLCGLTFTLFGQYVAKRMQAKLGYFILLPALCYALISYNMVYSLSVMWLDAVCLLPLILLGVERILEGKKPFFYMLILAYAIMQNYYTGYMLAVFTACYVVFRLVALADKNQKRQLAIQAGTILGATLLAVALAAPILFGVYKDLAQGKLAANNTNFTTANTTNFVFGQIFGKWNMGVYDSITNAGLPAVFCGYGMLVLALSFFIVSGIKIREKLVAAAIIILLLCSFYYVSLDKVWHGMQYPNWFPYRYAFLFSFWVIYLAFRALCAWSLQSKLQAKIEGMPRAALVKKLVAVVCIFVAMLELYHNGHALLEGLNGEFGYKSMAEYEAFVDKTQPLVEDIKATDSSFYRVNQQYEYSKNDALLFGYHGMTHYSSTFNAAINQLTPSLGIAQTYFWNSGYGSNLMLDSFFACKYILADRTVPNTYEQKNTTPAASASYLNPYSLSIAYSAPASNLAPYVSDQDVFANQNAFINGITDGQTNYFIECNPNFNQESGNQWSYTVKVPSSNPMYLYMRAEGTSWANVYVNDNWVGNAFSSETNGTLFLGDFNAGEEIVVRVVAGENEMVNPYYYRLVQLDNQAVTNTLQGLQAKGMEVIKQKGTVLKGTITVGEGERIMTSIPYDVGWTVKIDGKKVDVQTYAGTFMTIPCEAGTHTVEMHYASPGVSTGLVIAFFAVLLAIVYGVLTRKKEK